MASKAKHYLYNRRGDNCGVYIITGGKCSFRGIHDGKVTVSQSFENVSLAHAHAKLAVSRGERFGGPPTCMGTDSLKRQRG